MGFHCTVSLKNDGLNNCEYAEDCIVVIHKQLEKSFTSSLAERTNRTNLSLNLDVCRLSYL